MFERSERALKFVCAGLALLLILQVVRGFVRSDPLSQLKIPALPVLSVSQDAQSGGKGTNTVTNSGAAKIGTNSSSNQSVGTGTNALAAKDSSAKETNAAVAGDTNASLEIVTSKSDSNSTAASKFSKALTNSIPGEVSKSASTNMAKRPSTNITETNVLASADVTKKDKSTNAPGAGPAKGSAGPGSEMAMMMGPPGFGGPGGKKGAPLQPRIQAEVDKITDSEILGPVIRPMPMALLGLAGNSAFLRAPNGQTGLVKVGDELGGLKLLRIGTNRVLIEQEGEKKELTIFSGYGSETLMPKNKEPAGTNALGPAAPQGKAPSMPKQSADSHEPNKNTSNSL
jgi:hypothetical protein